MTGLYGAGSGLFFGAGDTPADSQGERVQVYPGHIRCRLSVLSPRERNGFRNVYFAKSEIGSDIILIGGRILAFRLPQIGLRVGGKHAGFGPEHAQKEIEYLIKFN